MNPTIKYLLISMFVGLFIINIYFRAKVMKAYKYLIQNNIEFSALDVFSKSKMENELLPKYPKHHNEIKLFVSLMKKSLLLSLGVIVLIITIGLVATYVI